MLDNDITVFQETSYVRVRRNALGNILEGLDQRALAWLAECVSNSEQPDISDNEEDQEASADEEGSSSSSSSTSTTLNVGCEKGKGDAEEKAAEKSSQFELNPEDGNCIIRSAADLVSPFVKSCLQLPPFTATRRNALHDLLETLTPAELTRLKQLYLLQLTLEPEDGHPVKLMAGRPRQLGCIIPHLGKFATHV